MAELKTKKNDRDVDSFLQNVEDPVRRNDCRRVKDLMQEVTGEPPRMWGDSIVGFGAYHYKYESGREGDWFLTGFSPRKQNLTLYIMSGFDHEAELMGRLGKYKTGKSCLYLKKLDDVDPEVLRQMIRSSVARMKKTYP